MPNRYKGWTLATAEVDRIAGGICGGCEEVPSKGQLGWEGLARENGYKGGDSLNWFV